MTPFSARAPQGSSRWPSRAVTTTRQPRPSSPTWLRRARSICLRAGNRRQTATGGPSAIDPGQAAALVASGGRSFQLAALALEASDEQATTASAQSNAAGDRLGRIIESLEGVQRGDSESAAKVDRLFDVIT